MGKHLSSWVKLTKRVIPPIIVVLPYNRYHAPHTLLTEIIKGLCKVSGMHLFDDISRQGNQTNSTVFPVFPWHLEPCNPFYMWQLVQTRHNNSRLSSLSDSDQTQGSTLDFCTSSHNLLASGHYFPIPAIFCWFFHMPAGSVGIPDDLGWELVGDFSIIGAFWEPDNYHSRIWPKTFSHYRKVLCLVNMKHSMWFQHQAPTVLTGKASLLTQSYFTIWVVILINKSINSSHNQLIISHSYRAHMQNIWFSKCSYLLLCSVLCYCKLNVVSWDCLKKNKRSKEGLGNCDGHFINLI